jgi:DNA-binding LytR/AlgR family response regulator
LATRILIAEDDIFISEQLKNVLIDLSYEVCGIVSSYKKAIEFLENNELPDIAILDIRMHNEDQGLEIANDLKGKNVPFIFTTSFTDKKTVQSAVNYEPKGYIVKPYSGEEIAKVLGKVLDELQPKFLLIKDKHMTLKIPANEILWVKSDNMYVEIKTIEKQYLHRAKLTEIQSLLPNNTFVRVHRSFLVNREYIDKTSIQAVYIKGQEIPVSKNYKENLKSIF